MSGRSGRHVKPGEVPGRVIIQTYSPEHPSIMAAIEADFEAFAVQELEIRKELSYPPFGKILSIRISGSDKDKTKTVASLLKRRGEELKSKFSSYREIQILGPSEAPLSRIKNQYRYQVLVKGLKTQVLNRFVRQVLGDSKWIFPQVQITVDVDPINML
jgi:primosomal protein N' (replication factor Y)